MPSAFIRVSASAITSAMGTLTTTSSAPLPSVIPMTQSWRDCSEVWELKVSSSQSLAAEVGGVVVVQPADVGGHQAVEAGLADHVERAPSGDVGGHGARGRRGARV